MKDRWLKAAFRDDKMVADLLILLKQHPTSSPPPPPPPPSSNSPSSSTLPPLPQPFQQTIPVSWGQKQPRSTPTRKYSTPTSTTTRCSPTTPLSWTTSPSDGAYDESSVSCTPSDPLSTSRSKNFSQLKEEETELLKERVNLKRELESINVNLTEQRNRSDNLKKIKFDLNQQSTEAGFLANEPEVRFADHPSQMEASTAKLHQSILPVLVIKEEGALANTCRMEEVAETTKGGFVLPDLNMPVGEDEIASELW